jgi:hypothetical protein
MISTILTLIIDWFLLSVHHSKKNLDLDQFVNFLGRVARVPRLARVRFQLCAKVSGQNRRGGRGVEHSRIVAVSCELETAKCCECSAMLRIGDRPTA